MAYESFLIDVETTNEALDEINRSDKQIVSTSYVADSGQLLIILQDRSRTFPSSGQGYQGEEEEE